MSEIEREREKLQSGVMLKEASVILDKCCIYWCMTNEERCRQGRSDDLTIQKLLKVIHKELPQRGALGPLQGVEQLLDFGGNATVDWDSCRRWRRSRGRWRSRVRGSWRWRERQRWRRRTRDKPERKDKPEIRGWRETASVWSRIWEMDGEMD